MPDEQKGEGIGKGQDGNPGRAAENMTDVRDRGRQGHLEGRKRMEAGCLRLGGGKMEAAF